MASRVCKSFSRFQALHVCWSSSIRVSGSSALPWLLGFAIPCPDSKLFTSFAAVALGLGFVEEGQNRKWREGGSKNIPFPAFSSSSPSSSSSSSSSSTRVLGEAF
jgi:hypothetical protein